MPKQRAVTELRRAADWVVASRGIGGAAAAAALMSWLLPRCFWLGCPGCCLCGVYCTAVVVTACPSERLLLPPRHQQKVGARHKEAAGQRKLGNQQSLPPPLWLLDIFRRADDNSRVV